MQPHTKAWLKERGLTGHEGYIPCEICGNDGVVDVHHIRGRIGALRTDPENLLGLCRSCHAACHSGAISREFQTKVAQRRRSMNINTPNDPAHEAAKGQA